MGQCYAGVGIIRSPPKRRRGGAALVVGRPPKRQRALTEAFKSPLKARYGLYFSTYRLRQALYALQWHLDPNTAAQQMMGDCHGCEA